MANRILEAASRAFGRLGYAAVRVEDILLEAEISRPTFYKAFRTKEGVFQALSERHHLEIRERIRAVSLESLEPLQMLARMVDTFLTWRAGLGPVGRVLDVEARTPGSCIAGDRKKTLQEMTSLLNQQLTASGRRAVDPTFLVALIAALESLADSLLSGKKRIDSAAMNRARAIALRLVSGALANPGEALPPLPEPP
ncbi:MAG: TetR/AcrR family transcriptional regulator [Myxococcales bacterium]